jgi:hypothetical protein
MLNKIYKTIHNRYSTLFKFIFFLRYLLGIFFISLILFLSIPHFLDFKKKDEVIKNYLLDSYGLKLNRYESIKYNSLPIPNLEIQNADMTIGKDSLKLSVENLSIYINLLNIYNFKDFKANKIVLNKNKLLLSDSDLKFLIVYIYDLKNRLTFKNLDLKINRKEEPLITLKKIEYSNYGYNKNIVTGELIGKKFKISIRDKFNKINFKLLNTGMTAEIIFNETKKESVISGVFKSKLLNSNLKFNFDYDDKKLKIYNSYFRSKYLSFNNESTIIYYPFFNLNSIFEVEDINTKILKKININKILNSKNFIKKINTKNKINFKSKKFSQNLIDNLNLSINLAYGRMKYSKKIVISDNFFMCTGNINLLQEYPILYFDCTIEAKDKKKFLRDFSIKYKIKNESFKLNAKGYINILNNKINFQNIIMNQNYEVSRDDLNYFKESFESIVFNEGFLNIFNLKKIKEFILEIY